MDIFTSNPLSVQLVPSWDYHVADITWKPSTSRGVVGYHVWRAINAPSNFTKLTSEPLQVTFFRDLSKVSLKMETPRSWVSPPDSACGVIAIRTSQTPICKAELSKDCKPILAGKLDLRVSNKESGEIFQIERVEPHSGLIEFGSRQIVSDDYTHFSQVKTPTKLEDLQIEYFSLDRSTDSTLGRPLYYKVTEVFTDGSESPLDQSPAISNMDLDPANVYWREAMRRNRFIFEQAGELAYVLLRRVTGKVCSCVDKDTFKPRTTCRVCWGVGFEGGYDGPYPFTMTPPNALSSVKQGPDGRLRARSAQGFIGPSPRLSSGDLIFRFNGERLLILDVDATSVNGSTLQQTYTAELLRSSDYRLGISITNASYPTFSISSNLPTSLSAKSSFDDTVPSTISLQEGVSTVQISDPVLDVTKVQSKHPEDIRTNTVPSIAPVFENWSF